MTYDILTDDYLVPGTVRVWGTMGYVMFMCEDMSMKKYFHPSFQGCITSSFVTQLRFLIYRDSSFVNMDIQVNEIFLAKLQIQVS